MKPSLLFAALLLFANSAPAQQPPRHNSLVATTQGYIISGFGGGEGGSINSGGRAVHYEPPRRFAIGDVSNNGPVIPSTYMNYDDALALGEQQLAAAQESAKNTASTSLGEIARAYRNLKVSTLKLEARAVQSNAAKLDRCNLHGANCRRL
jgi:hypothetical protein